MIKMTSFSFEENKSRKFTVTFNVGLQIGHIDSYVIDHLSILVSRSLSDPPDSGLCLSKPLCSTSPAVVFAGGKFNKH